MTTVTARAWFVMMLCSQRRAATQQTSFALRKLLLLTTTTRLVLQEEGGEGWEKGWKERMAKCAPKPRCAQAGGGPATKNTTPGTVFVTATDHRNNIDLQRSGSVSEERIREEGWQNHGTEGTASSITYKEQEQSIEALRESLAYEARGLDARLCFTNLFYCASPQTAVLDICQPTAVGRLPTEIGD